MNNYSLLRDVREFAVAHPESRVVVTISPEAFIQYGDDVKSLPVGVLLKVTDGLPVNWLVGSSE